MSKFYDEESEKALLGAIFLEPKILGEVQNSIKPETFYFSKHRVIYSAMLKLYSSGEAVDFLTVGTVLKNAGQTESAGGMAYISGLTDVVPTAGNFSFYMKSVYKAYQQRELEQLLVYSREKIGTDDPVELSRIIESKLYDISNKAEGSKIFQMPEVMEDFKSYVSYNVEHWNEEKGVNLGYQNLDRMTCGLQPTDMVVIGARPSIGKTALAVNMINNLLDRNVSVGLISAEMSSRLIAMRMVSQKAHVSAMKMRTGVMSEKQKASIDEAADFYKSKPLFIDDTPNITLTKLVSSCRHFKRHYGVKIIFIDYIGLVSVDLNGPGWEKVGLISKTLKGLARELQVPLVVLSQLGREAENNQPNLANIRGSGSVEQDADIVMFIDGERDSSPIDNPKEILERTLIVAKNRNGPVGKVYMNYINSLTRFEEDPDQVGREEEERERLEENKRR